VAEQPRHSPIPSLTSSTDVQLLIDSLYRMLKFLYLRWLSELSGYRDYCQHRALRQMEQEEGDLTSAGVCRVLCVFLIGSCCSHRRIGRGR
jgi:hypothetical protein